ncbi:MAG: plasmid pRiA4b ORF-3 family protein [Jatrophihabitantaceae bacterium]
MYLLLVAAGLPINDALLAEGMTIMGWSERGTHRRLCPSAAFEAARATWAVFRRLGFVAKYRHSVDDAPGEAARRLARAALLGRPSTVSAGRTVVSARRSPELAVQLRVALRHIEPDIWRRLVVPASLTLRQLHAVLQTTLGWEDYHLHLFEVDGVLYGDVEELEGHPLGEEETFTIAQAAEAVREFSYEYDFGDSWHHDIVIEQIMPSVGIGTPHLIDGARACPPEDCGGSGGFEELLEVLADPSDEEHADMLRWVGGSYDPEAFDLAELNAALELSDRHTRQRVR